MEIEFMNQTVIGSRELAALSKGVRKSVRRGRSRMVRIAGGAVILLNIFFAWVSFRAGDSRWWVNGALAVFLLVLVGGEDILNGRAHIKRLPPEAREITASFGPEGYTHVSKAAGSRFRYDQIQIVCETPEYFLFYLDHNLGQVYAKSGFTKGTAMAFRRFISAKTGMPVRNIQ